MNAAAERDEQRILLTQAEPGMVLSRPVLAKAGLVLCGEDTELSDKLIHLLTLRGIKRIFVRGQPLPAQASRPLEERLALLERRFSRVGHLRSMLQIKDAVARHLEVEGETAP
jgi:hypothetical protein